jgi:hypothetical protein
MFGARRVKMGFIKKITSRFVRRGSETRTPPNPNPGAIEDRFDDTVAGRDALTDVTADGGGQRSEVGRPYDGSGGVQRGVEKDLHTER